MAPLERAPYITDLTQTTAELSWATSGTTPGYATYGPNGNCTANKVTAGTKLPVFQPNVDTANAQTDQVKTSPSDYQYSVELGASPNPALSPGQTYCYEVFSSANVNLLGTGVSQSFSTLDAVTASTPLTFDVVGDLGETNGADESSNFVNEDQAAIDDEIGASGAKFVVTAGDVGYSGGTDADMGDLTKAPTSATNEVSNIFGQAYFAQTKGMPVFAGDGNHGAIIDGLRTWPEEQTAAASSGTYAFDAQTVDGVSGSYPDDWYAFSDAGVRIYVLDASWGDSADGTDTNALCPANEQGVTGDCKGYQMDDDAHWQPTSAEMTWLKNDLKTHSDAIKMAVFHYPVESVQNNQPSDPYLQRDLVPVLKQGGVQIVFNGHAHTYQRFIPNGGGLISYVTGGGGGTLEPVDGNNDSKGNCAAAIKSYSVYAIGYGSTASSACTTGNTIAQKSMVPAQIYNFLKVTVTGGAVTVDPENALGQTFDPQTYQLAQSSPPTTTTTSTTSTTTSTTTTTIGGGGGPVSHVQGATSSSKTVTLSAPSTAGDLLTLSASLYTGATNHITAITDAVGDVWKQATDANSSGHNSDGELWYTVTKGGATGVTVTTSASNVALGLQEFSGLGSAPAVTASSSSNTSTSASSGTASGTGLAVGFVAGHANLESMTPSANFINQAQVVTASPYASLVDGYQLSASSPTYGASFGAGMYWSAGVALFSG